MAARQDELRLFLVTIDDALRVAQECGLLLQGLGGTNGGVIGALAAVGLAGLTGFLSGIVPAVTGMRLKATEALRSV